MNADLIQQWLDLRGRIDADGEALKALKREADEVEAELLKEFERDGVQNMKIGGVTVYLHRDVRARPVAGKKDDLIGALVGTEWEWLVQPTINAQTLTAWAREQDRDERPLPEAMADLVTVDELFSIRARGR